MELITIVKEHKPYDLTVYRQRNEVVMTPELQSEINNLQALIDSCRTKVAKVKVLEENGFFKIWSSAVYIPDYLKVKAERLPIRIHRNKNWNLHGHHNETYLVCRIYDRKTEMESPLCWIKYVKDNVYEGNRLNEQQSIT